MPPLLELGSDQAEEIDQLDKGSHESEKRHGGDETPREPSEDVGRIGSGGKFQRRWQRRETTTAKHTFTRRASPARTVVAVHRPCARALSTRWSGWASSAALILVN